jgi:signal transduction histidine kinase/DNA-binding response OmpR family regulator/ligand-binding sensor domain-containing protein
MALLCRIWFRLFFGMLFPVITLPVYAQQNLKVEILSTDDGLSQGMIYDILQDREGFLWIATKDGLNRYDGYEFKVFTNDPNDPWSISGNTIVKLFEDSAGRIWAASDNSGLNIYDKKSGYFHHLRNDPNDPTSLSGNYVSAILEDSSGYFITQVENKEINMFRLENDFFNNQKPPQIIHVPMPPQKRLKKLSPDGIVIDFAELRGIVKDAKNRIWVGGNDAIYRLNVLKRELTLTHEGYSFETAYARPDGSIWASGYSQDLYNWNGIDTPKSIGNYKDIREIWEDEQENLWVASIDSLYGFDLTGWTPDASFDFGSDRCFYRWKPKDKDFPFKSLITDRSGILWVGTSGFGLYKNNPKNKAFFHHLPGVSIRKIELASESELYLQNFAFEWFKQDGPYLKLNRLHDDEPSTHIFLVTKSKEIWTRLEFVKQNYLQVKRYNPLTDKTRMYNISWHHREFQPMIACRNGSIWMAGLNDILTHINPITDSISSYDLIDGIFLNSIEINKRVSTQKFSTALYEDNNGILWVGTERGFTKVVLPEGMQDKLQITKYQNISNDAYSLSYNHVTCFLDDPLQPDRFLWISTKGGGINRMDKKSGQFKRWTKKDGLPDDVVYGILPDDEGNLWGSTNKGLFCMIPNKDTATVDQQLYTFRNFSKADGLQENEFNTGAYAKLPDGRLAFGGVNGYNVFDPSAVLSDDFIPPTYITNILINNQPVRPNDKSGILKNTIETTRKITLSYLDNIITLEFASLDFSAPDRNKYRYQLVGADDTWVEAGNRRSATFLHLPPREYIFRVQGSNSQGIWSDHIAEVKINVLPPWYRTWWAYLLYVTVLAMAIATYIRFSINRAKLQQQLGFEKQEVDRVRELDALKTRLFVNMTHEFRTPLTIIIGMAQQVMDDPRANFSGGMKMILSNGQNLLGMVNRMLNLSKLESGKMTLELVQGDMVLFLRNIVEAFRSFAAKKKIQLHFLPEVDVVMMDFDPDKMQQVISNLISNAFKFTPEGGHIYFVIRRENGSLRIRVKDTGCGIEEKDQDKIFDRFYQTDSSSTRRYEGTGIGLALCKNLVTLMEGQISVQSPPVGTRRGSEFTVILPIRQEVLIAGAAQHQYLEPFKNTPVENGTKASTTNMEAVQSATPGIEKQAVPFENIEDPLILLVEDNADVVAYIASCLGDYQLVVAENGQEGFEMATELIPDLIISDVMMPVMDGFELCQKLKTDERTDHIPVMILSARADMDSKIEGLELGANAYLPKPFDKQELLLNIRNLFELRSKLRRYYQNLAGLADSTETKVDIPNTSTSEDEFVIKVREMIEANINDFNFTVEQLASELHLSHSQFGRKLAALTGFTPNHFIRNLRLKKAKELLQNQELSITSVAYDCGFNDPSYFTRVFKKELGKTPLEWRSQEVSS